jgi:hypothetical protein
MIPPYAAPRENDLEGPLVVTFCNSTAGRMLQNLRTREPFSTPDDYVAWHAPCSARKT